MSVYLQLKSHLKLYIIFILIVSLYSGISSLVFTRDGEALYFHSSSELQRISLSATKVTSARCYLELPEGARNEQTADTTLTNEEDKPAEEQSPALVNGNSESKESSVADKVR